MNVSLFEAIGPIMTGPSSSHTAGAARLARVARQIAGEPPVSVSFGLHGSFGKTYRGHGTDKALLAGAMGLREDDERIANAYSIAEEAGVAYDFYTTDLGELHENSVLMTFRGESGRECVVVGSSVGGGQIVIHRIDDFETELSATTPTIIVSQQDRQGVVSAVSGLLAKHNINIAVMRVSRRARGDVACCVVETDSPIPLEIGEQLLQAENILNVRVLNFAAPGEDSDV